MTSDVPDVPEPRRVAVFAWVPGRPLAARLHPKQFQLLGRATAELHAHARAMDPAIADGAIRTDRLFIEPQVIGTSAGLRQPETAAACGRLDAAMARCRDLFARYRASDTRAHLCHGDLHPWNVHVDRRGAIALLDFDDSAVIWPAYDLGIACFYLRTLVTDDAEFARYWSALRAGYTSHTPWPADDRDIETFSIARQLVLANHLAAQRDVHLQAYGRDYLQRVDERLIAWA